MSRTNLQNSQSVDISQLPKVGDEKRPLPYFQCFASDWMASEQYVLMSASERGLLFSMLNAAWVNGSIPANTAHLSRILQLDEQSVTDSLSPRVTHLFCISPKDAARLICPELERQRAESVEYRKNRAQSGQKGGHATQARHRREALQSSTASSCAKATEMSRDDVKRDELKGSASIEKDKWPDDHKDWGKSYDNAPLRQS